MKSKLLRVYYYIIEFIKEVWLRPTLFIISVLLFYFSFDIPNEKLIYKSDVFLTPKFLFDNNDFKYSELKNYPNFYTKEEKRTKKLKKILK